MRKFLPLLLVLLCACTSEPPALAEPHILSITPAEQFFTESQRVTVQLDTDPRFLVNYSDKSVQMLEQPMLEIGWLSVKLDAYLGHGRFQGTVTPGLTVGRYSIRVTLGDGREATLSDAYEIKEGGTPPWISYWIESVGDQIQGQPFIVTIHAESSKADSFAGPATIIIYRGGEIIDSVSSGTFSGGVLLQELTINEYGEDFVLVIEDEQGNRATSNAFLVSKKQKN
ncbi:hypothetical protein JQX13_41570 [Archangium violaceum]|uniref:hypothetical protein n=1 Tax=Archangium violaceum TaxID=83451 RepID=UPI00193C28E8|nr:hypothetical protein [Archangium violaceum]QRK06521.1 hypothetical protein JQX13_41570 [Archangium violaceum]